MKHILSNLSIFFVSPKSQSHKNNVWKKKSHKLCGEHTLAHIHKNNEKKYKCDKCWYRAYYRSVSKWLATAVVFVAVFGSLFIFAPMYESDCILILGENCSQQRISIGWIKTKINIAKKQHCCSSIISRDYLQYTTFSFLQLVFK